MDALYLATAEDLLSALQAADAVSAARCVHAGRANNPGLHDLALGLASDPAGDVAHRIAAGYPSGALTEFEVETAWTGLRERGARLTRFLPPGELARVTPAD